MLQFGHRRVYAILKQSCFASVVKVQIAPFYHCIFSMSRVNVAFVH